MQIRSVDIKLECKTNPTTQQQLKAEFEKFLDIGDQLARFGRLDSVCDAILERAREWQLKCKRCKGVDIVTCTITFYEKPQMQSQVAIVDVLKNSHNAPSAILKAKPWIRGTAS